MVFISLFILFIYFYVYFGLNNNWHDMKFINHSDMNNISMANEKKLLTWLWFQMSLIFMHALFFFCILSLFQIIYNLDGGYNNNNFNYSKAISNCNNFIYFILTQNMELICPKQPNSI